MKPLIIALDVESDKEALALIKATRRYADIYKIGPGLVLKYGPPLFKKIRRTGRKIFLDLKFHDIPNTMLRSVKEAARQGVFSATVHSAAGSTALKSIAQIPRRPLLWGVTILTSLSSVDLDEIGFRHPPIEQVPHLAGLAKTAGLDGVVASVGETAELRTRLGPHFQIITPGIRLPGNDAGDQKRIATPNHARGAGATYFVVGRPILDHRYPERAAAELMRDWGK